MPLAPFARPARVARRSPVRQSRRVSLNLASKIRGIPRRSMNFALRKHRRLTEDVLEDGEVIEALAPVADSDSEYALLDYVSVTNRRVIVFTHGWFNQPTRMYFAVPRPEIRVERVRVGLFRTPMVRLHRPDSKLAYDFRSALLFKEEFDQLLAVLAPHLAGSAE
jgi:hypothetical protein